MRRILLKSKIHRAVVTEANPSYEGSISIDANLLEQVDIWHGERVLVVSIDSGERLETYAQPAAPGGGQIVMNGGGARRIRAGERVSIMAFCESEQHVSAKKVLCTASNTVMRET